MHSRVCMQFRQLLAKDADRPTMDGPQPCIVHNDLCEVPRELDVFHAGFACCQNSRMNPERFTRDITIDRDPVHDKSWQAVLKTISTLRPRFSILENTTGLKLLNRKSLRGLVATQ